MACSLRQQETPSSIRGAHFTRPSASPPPSLPSHPWSSMTGCMYLDSTFADDPCRRATLVLFPFPLLGLSPRQEEPTESLRPYKIHVRRPLPARLASRIPLTWSVGIYILSTTASPQAPFTVIHTIRAPREPPTFSLHTPFNHPWTLAGGLLPYRAYRGHM